MHHEMGEMVVEGRALVHGLALQRFARQGDVAQNANHWTEGFDLRKAQHIGGAVFAAPLLVQVVLFCVIGEQDRKFRRALDLGFRLLEGFEYGALGQRIEILRPSVVVADNGDFERRRCQRTTPSVAFSASFLAVSAS